MRWPAATAFAIIEDASHALGGRYQGEPIGNGRYSDITVFSFHPVKIVTTGEGGAAVTNDSDLAARMRLLRSHGVTRDARGDDRTTSDGPWYYQQIELGFNYRMTDLQAALGLSQLRRLDRVRRPAPRARRALRRGAARTAARHPVAAPRQLLGAAPLRHPAAARARSRGTHREVFEALRAAGIGVNLHYIPVLPPALLPPAGIQRPAPIPEAERYYAEAISLPMFPRSGRRRSRTR